MWSVSRRGLMPQPHRVHAGAMAADATVHLLSRMGASVRGYARAVRQAVRSHTAAGGDWRDVIGALRAHTPSLWHQLPEAERRRFIRRLQPYWDVLRHRCAPEAFERFQALRSAGVLRHVSGRVRVCDESDSHVDVVIEPRGGGQPLHVQVASVINCTGPNTDLRTVRDPLIRQLLDQGSICPDPLALGLRVDGQYAIVGADGRPSPVLRYIGPLLRARDWEATAVPELRMHARTLARRLVEG